MACMANMDHIHVSPAPGDAEGVGPFIRVEGALKTLRLGMLVKISDGSQYFWVQLTNQTDSSTGQRICRGRVANRLLNELGADDYEEYDKYVTFDAASVIAAWSCRMSPATLAATRVASRLRAKNLASDLVAAEDALAGARLAFDCMKEEWEEERLWHP